MNESFPSPSEGDKEGKPEAATLKERIRERVLDLLDPILPEIVRLKVMVKDHKEFSSAIEHSKKLSAETGEFFRSLIPSGLRKPDFDVVPDFNILNGIILQEERRSMEFLGNEVARLRRKEYEEHKKKILQDSLSFRDRVASQGEAEERAGSAGEIYQDVANVVDQEGDQNLIYEKISNKLEKEKNRNWAEASLVIQDINTGVAVDLNALLPNDFRYVPAAMDKAEYQPDQKSISGWSYKQKEAADLKDYEMGRSEPENFLVKPRFRTVNYGDLTKTGGMLSLFHEVAHSWQQKYYHSHEGKPGFMAIYDMLTELVLMLEFARISVWTEGIDLLLKKATDLGIECLDKNGTESPMNEEGVINIPSMPSYDVLLTIEDDLAAGRTPAERRDEAEALVAKARSQLRFYSFKGGDLQKMIETYISEERDAWAHAIRTIRFLREKGIDVEPQLEKAKDFKGIIDPCLGTYQSNFERNVLNEKMGYRFSRVPDEAES